MVISSLDSTRPTRKTAKFIPGNLNRSAGFCQWIFGFSRSANVGKVRKCFWEISEKGRREKEKNLERKCKIPSFSLLLPRRKRFKNYESALRPPGRRDASDTKNSGKYLQRHVRPNIWAENEEGKVGFLFFSRPRVLGSKSFVRCKNWKRLVWSRGVEMSLSTYVVSWPPSTRLIWGKLDGRGLRSESSERASISRQPSAWPSASNRCHGRISRFEGEENKMNAVFTDCNS